MVIFQKNLPYSTLEKSPYHIVKQKGWRKGYTPNQMMTFVVKTYCEKKLTANKKSILITINKEERKKYKKDICQKCIEKILSQRTD